MHNFDLLGWFEGRAASFFEDHASDRLPMLKADADRLRRLMRQSRESHVCFLGSAAIGKSTLINALAAGQGTLLPAGGVGPLTALATEVRYAREPYFRAWYHSASKLWKLGFGLERKLVVQLEIKTTDADDGAWKQLDPTDKEELIDPTSAPDGPDAKEEARRANSEVQIKQAQQLITGDQNADRDLAYLVDCIRLACGYNPRWGATPRADDETRIRSIVQALARAKDPTAYERRRQPVPEDARPFREELRDHAAGFLAPLIQRIEVGWPSPLLQEGVVLVDLPGVGIADDTYQQVTAAYVRERARALVVVVDRAGMTDASRELLRTSGYIGRLVGTADDFEADRCALLVAVTRVDDVAVEELRRYADAPRDERPSKAKVFDGVVQELCQRVKTQLSTQLANLPVSDNDAVRTARLAAREKLLEDLQVHPVSAPEYRLLLADDDYEKPRLLSDPVQSGIPQLQESLRQLASDRRKNLEHQRHQLESRLMGAILSELDIIRTAWTTEQRAEEEADRLRKQLETFLAPKQAEYGVRLGAFREFLDATVDVRIAQLVLEARLVAQAEVSAYLTELRGVSWATLRAAVQRGGIWVSGRGRRIDLPNDIAGLFQEPMAAVWSQRLLQDIRVRTRRLARDVNAMVDEVVVWGRDHAGSQLIPEQLESQQKRVVMQMTQLDDVGLEAVDDLRIAVKNALVAEILKPIEKTCREFVVRGDHIGPGVKNRILDLFRELAQNATEAAQRSAQQMLRNNFATVRSEIFSVFQELGDPLQNTASVIVASHEQRIQRSNVQRRRRVLDALDDVMQGCPPALAEAGRLKAVA